MDYEAVPDSESSRRKSRLSQGQGCKSLLTGSWSRMIIFIGLFSLILAQIYFMSAFTSSASLRPNIKSFAKIYEERLGAAEGLSQVIKSVRRPIDYFNASVILNPYTNVSSPLTLNRSDPIQMGCSDRYGLSLVANRHERKARICDAPSLGSTGPRPLLIVSFIMINPLRISVMLKIYSLTFKRSIKSPI